jgi:hypothetical protein
MSKLKEQQKALEGLIKDLQVFIELSFQDNEISLADWIEETINRMESRCWKKKHCDEKNCPAYGNECGRCWLIAGTMCGGKPHGQFVEKYESCTECEVFQEAMGDDQVRKLRELIIVLIHSLRLKQLEVNEALSNVKILSGLLPICASCKKIRDEAGYWNQIESYIRDHSEAEFSHGVCNECAEKLYGDQAWYDKPDK